MVEEDTEEEEEVDTVGVEMQEVSRLKSRWR